jgi:hypothetical protein
MNLEHDDEKLEAYLQQFRAQAPRPLPARTMFIVRRRVAVFAAVAVVFLGLIALTLWREKSAVPTGQQAKQRVAAPEEISIRRLSRIAREEPEKLDSHLDELSKKLLPDAQSSKGVLKELAKE